MSEALEIAMTSMVYALRRTGILDKCSVRAMVDELRGASHRLEASDHEGAQMLSDLAMQLERGPLQSVCSGMSQHASAQLVG